MRFKAKAIVHPSPHSQTNPIIYTYDKEQSQAVNTRTYMWV